MNMAITEMDGVELHAKTAHEFEERYDSFAADPYTNTFTYGRKKIEELIDRELEQWSGSRRALDAGCGTGFNLHRLTQRGFDAKGLEPADEMRERAIRDNPGCEILNGSIEQIPFASDSFDLLLSIEVIRYLASPETAVREVHRVLAPGGRAIITAAPRLSLNGYALINGVASRVPVPSFSSFKHKFVTAKSAERMFRDAGFRDVQIYGLFFGPWHVMGRLMPKALSPILKRFESVDEQLSRVNSIRDLANHLVIVATK